MSNPKKWSVVIFRFGCVEVEAETKEEAMRIANTEIKTDDVEWNDDWCAADCEEVID